MERRPRASFPSDPRRPGRREGHYAPSAGGALGDDATGVRLVSRHFDDVKTH